MIMSHIIHSPIAKYLIRCHFLTIINSASMNIPLHVLSIFYLTYT